MAGGRFSYQSGVILSSDGTASWLNPMMFKSLCKIKVKYFPFDIQQCELKFGSWMYDGLTLNLLPMPGIFPTSSFQENGEWEVYRVKMKRNVVKYSCCPSPYVDLTLTIKMGRQSMDYFINLILPCCLISSMIFLGFILPPESGERIGLSITVLLAMTVFQQLTSEIMPSYHFPILGQYYFAIILEIGASVVVTTMILNFYHRTNRKMPRWMKRLVIEWIATIVFLRDTPEKRNILHRKSTRKSRKKGQRIIDDIGVTNIAEDQHNQGSNVTFNDAITYCGTPCSEPMGTEMENRSCQNNYGMSAFQSNISSHEVLEDQSKEEARPYMNEDNLSEGKLKIRHLEWTLAARILDRFFLVVAIVCGIVTVLATFLSAPKLWDNSKKLTVNNPEAI